MKKLDFDPLLVNQTYCIDAYAFLKEIKEEIIFDLVVTSPPYNIGKEYEDKKSETEYLVDQEKIIEEIVKRIKPGGSLCWQVGNFIKEDSILPLDIVFHPIFSKLGLKLKNRIIWKYGHGLHSRKKFSGRYEVILWYVKPNADYTFNLNDVRIPQKYPGKRSSKGPNKGRFSGNPNGKNPEDVWDDIPWQEDWGQIWDIPNVKANHVEKTEHPCQFPVVLVERLVKALTNKGDLVYDPYMGVGSSGVASLYNDRRFLGTEIHQNYHKEAIKRLKRAMNKEEGLFREDKPVYDHKKSSLSKNTSFKI